MPRTSTFERSCKFRTIITLLSPNRILNQVQPEEYPFRFRKWMTSLCTGDLSTVFPKLHTEFRSPRNGKFGILPGSWWGFHASFSIFSFFFWRLWITNSHLTSLEFFSLGFDEDWKVAGAPTLSSASSTTSCFNVGYRSEVIPGDDGDSGDSGDDEVCCAHLHKVWPRRLSLTPPTRMIWKLNTRLNESERSIWMVTHDRVVTRLLHCKYRKRTRRPARKSMNVTCTHCHLRGYQDFRLSSLHPIRTSNF